jgi:hypothetical protein
MSFSRISVEIDSFFKKFGVPLKKRPEILKALLSEAQEDVMTIERIASLLKKSRLPNESKRKIIWELLNECQSSSVPVEQYTPESVPIPEPKRRKYKEKVTPAVTHNSVCASSLPQLSPTVDPDLVDIAHQLIYLGPSLASPAPPKLLINFVVEENKQRVYSL